MEIEVGDKIRVIVGELYHIQRILEIHEATDEHEYFVVTEDGFVFGLSQMVGLIKENYENTCVWL